MALKMESRDGERGRDRDSKITLMTFVVLLRFVAVSLTGDTSFLKKKERKDPFLSPNTVQNSKFVFYVSSLNRESYQRPPFRF